MARKTASILGLAVVFTLASLPAWADGTCAVGDFLSTLDTPKDAATGTLLGPGPYGTVCVALSGQVATITFDGTATSTVFGDGGTAALEINSASFTPAPGDGSTGFLVEMLSGGDVTSDFKDFTSGSYSGASSLGSFDLILDNKNFGSAGPADTLIFTVTNNGTPWASASDVLKDNGSGFDAAAHVRVGGSTGNTGFVAESFGGGHIVGNPVPEPGFLLVSLAGLGLTVLVNQWRRRRA